MIVEQLRPLLGSYKEPWTGTWNGWFEHGPPPALADAPRSPKFGLTILKTSGSLHVLHLAQEPPQRVHGPMSEIESSMLIEGVATSNAVFTSTLAMTAVLNRKILGFPIGPAVFLPVTSRVLQESLKHLNVDSRCQTLECLR